MKKTTQYISHNGTIIKATAERVRSFSLMSYIPPSSLEKWLYHQSWIRNWAMAVHDQDMWSKADEEKDPSHKAGEAKQTHTHILLYTYEAKTSSAVLKRFENLSKEIAYATLTEPQNTFCEVMHDSTSMWRYLRHLDDYDKHRYGLDAIRTNDLGYWEALDKDNGMGTTDNVGYSIFRDMLDGCRTEELIKRYGMNYIRSQNHLKQCIVDHDLECEKDTFNRFQDMCRLALADAYSDRQIEVFIKMLQHCQYAMNNTAFHDPIMEKNLKA